MGARTKKMRRETYQNLIIPNSATRTLSFRLTSYLIYEKDTISPNISDPTENLRIFASGWSPSWIFFPSK